MVEQDSPHGTVFRTSRLMVRFADPDDVGLYFGLWTNPEVMRMVGFPQGLPVTREEIANRLADQPPTEFERLLVVALRDGRTPIGECCLHAPDEAGVAEPDLKLLPEFWGFGYGAEVWRGLVAYLFEHTACEVVQSTPNVENLASITMMEKAGGVRVGRSVGHFPESMQAFTAPVPYYIYEIKREDWERRPKESPDAQ